MRQRRRGVRTVLVVVLTGAAAALPLLATTHATGLPGIPGLGGDFVSARGGAGGDATGGTGDPAGDGGESIGGNGGIAFNVPLALPTSTTTTSTTSTTLAPQPTLTLSKSCTPTNQGSVVSCTITVSNNSGVDANGVVVNDPTPAGTSLNGSDCSNGSEVVCNVGTLAAGQSFVISADFDCDIDGTITNVATATSDNAGGATATTVAQCAQPV